MRWLLQAIVATGCLFALVAPAIAIHPFTVFFDGANPERLEPDQWRIGPEGAAVVAEFARNTTTSDEYTYVLLIGNDQRVGKEEDALTRSQRRAEAVRELLIQRGIPSTAIRTVGCGWSRLVIETEHGVPEAQNRNVFLWWMSSDAESERAARTVCSGRF